MMKLIDPTQHRGVNGGQSSYHEEVLIVKTYIADQKLEGRSAMMENCHQPLIQECHTLRHDIGSTKESFVRERFSEHSLSPDFPECRELPVPFRLVRGRNDGNEWDVLLQHRVDLEVYDTYLAALEVEENNQSHSNKPNYAERFQRLRHRTRRVIVKLEGRLSQTQTDHGASGAPTASRVLPESNDRDARALYIQTQFHDYQATCCRNVEFFANKHGCL